MKEIITAFIFIFCLGTKAQIITTIAGNGCGSASFSGCFSGDGGPATAASLWNPEGVAIDPTGNVYIADNYNNRIRIIATDGIINTIAGSGYGAGGSGGFSGDGGPATAADLYEPHGVTLDATGNYYIVDYNNNRIRKVNTAGIISTVAGNGYGAGGGGGYSGDGGPATAAELYAPFQVALDVVGNLYIADFGNNVIRKVNTANIISTFAGTGTAGYSGDGGSATAAQLHGPGGLTFDAYGNLYFADSNNNRVRKVNSAGIISTIAGNGTEGYSGDGGSAISAELGAPISVALDAAMNLYIADESNNVIRMINTVGIISTFAGNGYGAEAYTGGYLGDGGPAAAAEFYIPIDVSVDGSGNIYIADYANNRIRKVTPAGQAGIQTYDFPNVEFSIYPNPANSVLHIAIAEQQSSEIEIIDVLGNKLLSAKEKDIDIEGLPAGVYFIQIANSRQKFIKQ